MRRLRQHEPIRLPLVGEVPGTRPVLLRQGRPPAPGRSRPAATQHPGYDAPTVALDGQPKPDFALFAPHTGLHFIEFEHVQSTRFGPQLGRSLRFFLPA